MNIRDLKYLIAVADHCHFGKAAEACFVSQPALSMQIKKLEDSLGVQLIERTNKSVMLTDVGKQIIKQAQVILHGVNTLHEIANQAKDPYSGELHLGVIPTLGPYLLPHIIPVLAKHYPKLKIYISEDQTHNLVSKLKNGKLDCAMFGYPQKEEDFEAQLLMEEELFLAVPMRHSLAKKKQVRHADLSNQVLMLLEDGHCLRESILELCRIANASPDKSFQATSLETMRHMVASNVGMTLMPKLSCRANDGICYLPFRSPKTTRKIGFFWRRSSAKSLLLENMLQHIKKQYLNFIHADS